MSSLNRIMRPYSYLLWSWPSLYRASTLIDIEIACPAPWAYKVLSLPLLQIMPKIPTEGPSPLPKPCQKYVALPQLNQRYLYKRENVAQTAQAVWNSFWCQPHVITSHSASIYCDFVPVCQLQHKTYFLSIDFLGHALIYLQTSLEIYCGGPKSLYCHQPLPAKCALVDILSCSMGSCISQICPSTCWFSVPHCTVYTLGHGPTKALLTHRKFSHPQLWLTASLASLMCVPTELCSPSLHCHQPA